MPLWSAQSVLIDNGSYSIHLVLPCRKVEGGERANGRLDTFREIVLSIKVISEARHPWLNFGIFFGFGRKGRTGQRAARSGS